MEKALFIFRRDLRIEDNTGLIYALENAKEVLCAFIFTPEQIENNPYRSDHCLQFMIESLEELELSIKKRGGNLYFFYGHPENIVEECISKLHVDGVVVNRDYTPYSLQRDKKIASSCKNSGIPFYSFDDALLHPPEQSLKQNGQPFKVFTPYFRHSSQIVVLNPKKNLHHHYYSKKIPFALNNHPFKEILPNRNRQQKGGRSEAIKILQGIKKFSDYQLKRDLPYEQGTTHLSPHLKFTTCSPREVYWTIVEKLGPSAELIRSLYWRDFFTSIAFHFPEVFSGSFHPKFNRLKWNEDESAFKRWCEGNTGFPIVDAGMREMNLTGFMHNRVRMIVGSFLVKDLHMHWKWGEQYFARTLIDYDPAVNNGNWQWVASTGCDAQPYFRVFNPWTQAKKFDPDCLYIKKWIPEMAQLSSAEIHRWDLQEKQHGTYPLPMLDHAKEAKITRSKFYV